ncbi:MAG: type III-A CRISPR-associated RAMP protein Csm3 [Thermodesulfobacteriota bacterium]
MGLTFKKRFFITGTLTALTGLHIGGNSTEMSIGGADQIVIRDPLTNFPYIPGSSLRGKMRSLFERTHGEMTFKLEDRTIVTDIRQLESVMASGQAKLDSASPSTDPKQLATKLFGVPIDKQGAVAAGDIVPQRLVVRDARLLNPEELEKARNTDMPMTEVKTEVAIDRITSKANPRQIERVPAGARFGFELILNLYGEDEEAKYLKAVFECMELLQDDYLGGHGSRGYGKVRFHIESITEKTAEDYRSSKTARVCEVTIPETLKQPPQAS